MRIRAGSTMFRKLISATIFALTMIWAGAEASAQTLAPPPPMPPALLWTANFPDDVGGWSSPDEACEVQREHYNPNATPLPTEYNGGQFASCNWQTNPNSNTILPGTAVAYCPSGWIMADPGVCMRPDYQTDSRAQCDCEPGATPPGGTPMPGVGNPVALNHGAKVEQETDYLTADGRFGVERKYYSLGEDYTNVTSPTAIPGFGGRWHGVIPGRLAVSGQFAEKIEYLNVSGGFSIFQADEYNNVTHWGWHTYGATRRHLSMVAIPTSNRDTYFQAAPAVPNGPGEVRMEMAQGEYILFRRAAPVASGPRYLVPVERGFADGYKIYYTYPDSGEFPSTVSDSLGRQMTLTWTTADRQTYGSLSTMYPVKVISEVALPDSTKLQYTYSYGTDQRGSRIKDRLDGVKRLSGTGTLLWGRTYLYENTALPYALTGKVNQVGYRLSTYAYDPAGLVTSTETTGGIDKYTIENFEEQGVAKFWRKVTNPLGHRTDYIFFKDHNWADAQRVLSSVVEHADTNVEAATTNYQYYGYVGDMVIANHTDERGFTRDSAIDSQQRPTTVRDAVGTTDERTTNLTWHPVFDLPTQEKRTGLTIDYTYGTTGLLLTRTETDTTTHAVPYSTNGQTRTWTYNWNGNGGLLSVNGPKGLDANGNDDISSYSYDAGGNLLTATNALGRITRFENYDANGRPGKMTDSNGVVTLYTYDALGRLETATVKDPVSPSGDAVTTLEYDLESRISAITSPLTQKLLIARDPAGRIQVIRNANNDKIVFAPDAMGNITLETVRRSNGTIARQVTRTFDGLGRLLTETLGPSRTSSYAYDKLGNMTGFTSARSNATVQAFDGLNRLISSVAPDTGTGQIGYDVFDQETSFTDPKSVQTTYIRNGFGEVIQETSPDRGTSVYHYDAAGDVIATIDGRGQRIDLIRDALGRVTKKTPVGRPVSEIVQYGYDADVFGGGSYGIDRLISVIDGTGKTQFKYDHRGNVLIKRIKTGTIAPADLSYTYDLADRITSITYPSGRVVTYTRDLLGRVTAVTTKANASAPVVALASGITYEPMGSMLTATYGNGLSLSQSWGNDGRLASRRLFPTAGGGDVSALTYGYDNDDNIVSIADGVDPNRSITFGYDTVGRLNQSVAASGSLRRTDFLHDVNGNRTQVEQRVNPTDASPASTAVYTLHSGTNRLASVTDAGGTRSIGYDGRGNTASETRPGGTVTVGYDGYGRLTSYQTSGGIALVHGYNALDERVSTTDGGVLRHFVYDNDGRLMGEYGSSTADVKAETIWLSPEVAASGQPFGGDDGAGGYAPLAVVTNSGAVYWVHGNHLGVPIVTTDSSGNAAAPTGYTRVGFPGQTQTLADLYYNVHRDYDPTTGRYIQADPIGLDGGSNPYVYAENSPVGRIDPLGLQSGPTTWEVIEFGFDWWAKRQIKKVATRRIPIIGPALSLGDALGATAAVTVYLYQQNCKNDKPCPPCKTASGKIVPVGTIGYRFDKVPPGRPHHPFTGDHYNLYRANQMPSPKCDCFWQPINDSLTPPPGSIPVEPFVN